MPDIELLDEATREVVLARARKVAAQPGAIAALTKLCVGPDGPLPDLEVRSTAQRSRCTTVVQGAKDLLAVMACGTRLLAVSQRALRLC